jgi:hypothetical protein
MYHLWFFIHKKYIMKDDFYETEQAERLADAYAETYTENVTENVRPNTYADTNANIEPLCVNTRADTHINVIAIITVAILFNSL